MATGASFVTMLCVDGSEHSEQAFNYYTSYIHKSDNKLIILHVAGTPAVPALAISAPLSVPIEDLKRITEDNVHKSEVIAERYSSICKHLGIQHQYAIHHPNGRVGEAIVDEAKKRDADLVVIGSRSQRLSRTFYLSED
ncbi:uncharacterized protein LOC120346518 [Styela clava]